MLGMSGAVPLFPLHAFMLWEGTALPLWHQLLRICAFGSNNELLIGVHIMSAVFSNSLTH
jgi:hypothetical protein